MGSYTTVQGDTWDMIAKKVYGSEKYTTNLMEANRLLIEYMIFPGGVTLAIPDLPEETDDDLPIWRD